MDGERGGAGTPEPAAWSRRRSPWVLATMALLGVLTLLVLLWAGTGLSDRDWVRVIGGVVLALLLGSTVGFLAISGTRGSGAAPQPGSWPDGVEGVRFDYSTATYCWFSLLVAGCVLVLLGGGVAVGSVFGVLMIALAALLGWYLMVVLWRAPGGLLVSPSGIAHRGLTNFYSVPWHVVRGVEARDLGTSALVVKADPSPQSVLRRYTGWFDTGELRYLPFLVVRTYWLAADREVVRSVLAFYLAHPERRGELATQDAVRRIAEGRTRD
ncbi:hypothetical protein [Micromonospora sp. MA102]|uniref:hypothetical protein n=1 Tax=Micromonospora sp. MA102 TaxID=2952755 RepID=UPI0021C63B9A|nr:hypothetical protein [Micromonospora sp. MA102]